MKCCSELPGHGRSPHHDMRYTVLKKDIGYDGKAVFFIISGCIGLRFKILLLFLENGLGTYDALAKNDVTVSPTPLHGQKSAYLGSLGLT